MPVTDQEARLYMRSLSPAQTRALGIKLSSYLRPGDVLILRGDLGAGKSEFTRGIAQGLGINGPIPSPSFTILNVYEEGRLPLYHFDWYRLNSSEELYEMGMDEYLMGDGVSVVEWPSQCPDAVPEDCLEIHFQVLDENSREIEMTSKGHFRTIQWEDKE